MPKVRVIAAPRKDHPGFWALGRTGSYDVMGSVVTPAKSGVCFTSGVPVDMDVTDAELAELQSPPNDSFLAVMVLQPSPAPPASAAAAAAAAAKK